MGSLLKDVQFGLRMALKHPGMSIIVILTFGLGIGLTTTVFSIVNGIFFKGLPFEEPERIVFLGVSNPSRNLRFNNVRLHDYADWKAAQTSFEALAMSAQTPLNLGMEEGRPQRVSAGLLTPSAFSVLRVQPVLGRAFSEEDVRGTGGSVILIGYDLWQERFRGNSDVLGKTIRASGEIRTVIGVMPEGFAFPNLEQAWIPLDTEPGDEARGQGPAYDVMGRLRPGVSLTEARAEMASIAQRLALEYPESNEGFTAEVRPNIENMDAGGLALTLTMLGAVLAVMLIVCVNVANLLTSKTSVRAREMAVRTALGASRGRVISQLLGEILVLALLGGGLGFLLGTLGIEWFKAVIQVDPPPFWIRFDHDHRVVLFAIGVTVLAGVVSGLIPALQVTKSDVGETLKDGNRGSSGSRVSRVTGGLVMAEVALSCGLLISSGLMIKSVTKLMTVDLPFATEGILTARINLTSLDYPEQESRTRFYEELLTRLENLQGVEAATVSDGLPAAGNSSQVFEVEGREYPTPESFHQAREGTVTPGYFRTFQTELIHGRTFQASDREGDESVCIVNETFARNFFDGNALGKRIRRVAVDLSVPGYLVQDPDAPWLRVVGVAPDMHMEGIGNNDQSPAGYYVPVAQMPVGRTVSLAVRTRGSPLELVGGVRSAVESIDSNLPISQVLPMRGVIHRQTWFYRVFGTLFMSFGFAALFLAAVGLFGVMSFAVSQRTRELGVRMALGAQGGQLMAMVLRKSALQLALGLGIGLVLAILAAGPLQMILFEVDARDPVVFGSVTLTLAGAGFLATFLPARRVTKVDPVTALTPR